MLGKMIVKGVLYPVTYYVTTVPVVSNRLVPVQNHGLLTQTDTCYLLLMRGDLCGSN